jgi:hypothetical protein
LLSAWKAACVNEERSIGWLSLDESDDDPTRFWTYVIAALQRVRPGVGEQALTLLDTPRTPIESILSSLINNVAEVPRDLILPVPYTPGALRKAGASPSAPLRLFLLGRLPKQSIVVPFVPSLLHWNSV